MPLSNEEIFRVLRPGGRMVISDIVASEQLPAKLRDDPDLICGCTGGAAVMDTIPRDRLSSKIAE